MNYQLVLQFRDGALESFREIPDFEDSLQRAPGLFKMFDGIDLSPRVANIFFYTNSPAETFQQVRALLEKTDERPGFSAAYRTVAQDRFRVLWPEDSDSPFALR